MSGPALHILSDPPLALLAAGDRAPGPAHALIGGVGPIRRPATGEESGNVTVDLDNADGAVSRLFAIPPLGAPATLSGPGGEEWFRGTLAAVSLAETATLTLEI